MLRFLTHLISWEKKILEAREIINNCKHDHGDVFEKQNMIKLCDYIVYFKFYSIDIGRSRLEHCMWDGGNK